MKNLVKAVALLTVMCMILSVSAFAAGTATTENETIDITVAAGASEEVAVLIVEAGADLAELEDEQIHYVDQLTTDSSGAASKEDVALINEPVMVDVYIGSSSLGTARLIGANLLVGTFDEITLISSKSVYAKAETNWGFAAAVDVVIPEDVSFEKMVWAFKVAGDGWRFSNAVTRDDSMEANVADAIEGQVQFAAAFNAVPAFDSALSEITVDEFAVIFITSSANKTATVVGTNDDLTADQYITSAN